MLTVKDIDGLICAIASYFVLFILVAGAAFLFHHFVLDL